MWVNAALTRLKPVWNDRSISLSSKTRLMCSLVTSIILYACESWSLTAKLQRSIQAVEMRCYRKVLRISYKDHVTNEEVRAKIQQAIGPHEDPPDHRKETQIAVVWSCLPFIRSGILARHSERGKKIRQTEKEVGRQHQGMDRPGVRQVPEGRGERGENGGNWLRNHLWCPLRLRDRWWWWWCWWRLLAVQRPQMCALKRPNKFAAASFELPCKRQPIVSYRIDLV